MRVIKEKEVKLYNTANHIAVSSTYTQQSRRTPQEGET